MKNGLETDVDCGGGVCPVCAIGKTCNAAADCLGSVRTGGTCTCGNRLFTFTVNSSAGGLFTGAQWPGGQATQNYVAGCGVTINRPNARVDLVCSLADPFQVSGWAGFSTCYGSGGEDGDGCQPISCPPLGIGSCCDARPSCSTALNGSAQAQYIVQCLN